MAYLKSAHRGMPTDQVEWTFPINLPHKQFNKPLPETKILMDLFKQDVLYMHSIHGNEFSGLHAHVSDYKSMMSQVYHHITKSVMPEANIPTPDFDFVKMYSKGLYSAYTLEQILEHGENPSNVPSEIGECSWGYFLNHHRGAALISEVPMMFDSLRPQYENKAITISRKKYYKYWQAKFEKINLVVQPLWEEINQQVPDSRVKRIQKSFVAEINDLARPSREEQQNANDSTLLPFLEFRLSQLYFFRRVMNVFHNFEWLQQQHHDIALNEDDWKQLKGIINLFEVEIPITFLGIQFFDVPRIVKAQFTLGLCYQLLMDDDSQR